MRRPTQAALCLTLFVLFAAVPVGAQTITGTVFADPDADGARDPGELGAPGIVVSAYDAAGLLAAQTASCGLSALTIPADPPGIPVPINVAACALGSEGAYTLSGLTAATEYRVEFTWSDPLLFAGAEGSQSDGAVRFETAGATGVDQGVNYPEDYCQNDPRLVAGCYVFPPPFTSFPPWDPTRTDPLIVSWPYFSRFATATNGQVHPHADDADYGDLGHVFGVTVHRATRKVFFAAVASPTWDAGALGIGGIYTADYTGAGDAFVPGSIVQFVDLGGLVNLTNQFPITVGVLDRFGEQGLGGIDFSEDDEILWAINMGNGRLIRIAVGDPPVAPVAADVTEIDITGHGCASGRFRPGAVETRRGSVFVGGVCDGSTGTAADLRAVVLEYDGATFTSRLSTPLGFLTNQIFPLASFGMAPWSATDSATQPQPSLTNLAFDDDGSLILGLMPRVMYNSFAQTAGWLLRAQVGVTGDFTLESGGVSGSLSSTARTAWGGSGFHGANPPLSEGPGGTFFFENGIFSGVFAPPPFTPINSTTYHSVLFSAGVTVVAGTGEVAAGFVDPVSINSFGVRYLDRDNGLTVAGLQFGGLKVALVSDVDAICRTSPLELGDRLWCDGDSNGVQDPGEAGVTGVDVVLTCAGDNPVTVATGANGRYLFTDTLYAAANSGSPMPRGGACSISIETAGANGTTIAGGCGTAIPSPADNGGADAGADLRDSDGSLSGTTVVIPVVVGDHGENDHSLDQGFAGEELDYGDAPDSYATTSGASGANHTILTGLSLGANEDSEADGQPSPGADGDDVNGAPDDEDGVVFGGGMAMAAACSTGNAVTVSLTNSTGGSALLDAWIDFNGNGGFDHPTEHLFGGTSAALSAGANNLNYDVPCTAVAQGVSYARFRLSSAGGLAPSGAAVDGEVEDYVFQIKGLDYGDAPDSYPTTQGAGGASHVVDPMLPLYLGACVDTEADGQPAVAPGAADGDDANDLGAPGSTLGTCVANDDEDGVSFDSMVVACGSADLTVGASQSGALDAWIDFDGDGVFGAGEQIFAAQAVAAGANALSFSVPCDTEVQAVTYARFRLSSAGGLGPAGPAPDGEVEDYAITTKGLDLGDAPSGYGTLLAGGGASHAVDPGSPVYLGACVDTEVDGQPVVAPAAADGDDLGAGVSDLGGCAGPDDEDGVAFAGGMAMAGACESTSLTVTLGGTVPAALLDAWIDFDGNGSFDDPAEHLFGGTSAALSAGGNSLPYTVPCAAVPGPTYARFRVSTAGGLAAVGPAMDGEVEDYGLLLKGLDYGDAPESLGYPTLLASDGARHVVQATGNPTLGAAPVDVEPDGQPNIGHTGDDVNGTPDDEDGVVVPAAPLVPGTSGTVVVTGGATGGLLDAWIDFNGDGVWSGGAEQIATGLAIPAGTMVDVTFAVPIDAVAGSACSRFRISTAGGLAPTGLAPNGEVEDYPVAVGMEDPVLGVAKQLLSLEDVGGGVARAVFEISLTNMGNVALSAAQADADLATAFAASGSFTVVSVLSPTLTPNPGFDGDTDVNLLSGTDTLGVGEQGVVELTVDIDPAGEPGPYFCSSTGTASSPSGQTVTDVSQNGGDPDPGNNGPGDDSEPTPVELGVSPVEIPTLDEVGLLALMALLALAGLAYMRRQGVAVVSRRG